MRATMFRAMRRWPLLASMLLAAVIAMCGLFAPAMPPTPASAQSTIDFTISVSGNTATVEADVLFANEEVDLTLFYRTAHDSDRSGRIYVCTNTDDDLETTLTSDANGDITYTVTDSAISETYGVTGCITVRSIVHWASSVPLITVTPDFSTMDLQLGLPSQTITVTGRINGGSTNSFRIQAGRGATITITSVANNPSYSGDSIYSFDIFQTAPGNTMTFTVTPNRTSDVGFSVWRHNIPFQNHRQTFTRSLPAGTPVPTPTVSTAYANEADLRVEGGPGQITATFEICCFRTYLLELRDIRSQAKLLQWSYVSEANTAQYIAPPAVFSNLDSGTEYGICLYTVERQSGSPGSRSAHSGEYLCYTATTNLPTPTPAIPTPTPVETAIPTITPTALPGATLPHLFGTPTPIGGVVRTATPVPTAGPTPLPTPTPWDEVLLYTSTAPAWEASPQVQQMANGEVEILVQWTGIAEADYYELLITDGHMAGRTDRSADAVLRQHRWSVKPSDEASRVRVRAVKEGSPYSALVSNVDHTTVVIPAGQTAYSPFSAERLISTNITELVPQVSPTQYGDGGISEYEGRHGGALHGFGFWLAEQLGTGAHWTTWAYAQGIWLMVCVTVMAVVIIAVGRVSEGAVGPWPFASGTFVFFAMWSGLGGEIAGLELADRFLPPVLIGFIGFIIIRGRGWIG